jgi:DNA uptake protein ComE-like DNA-binding protein
MRRFLTLLMAAATSLGLAMASSSAMAQKTEAPKAAPKADAKVAAPKAAAPAAAAPAAAAPAADKKVATAVAPMDINSASEKELASLEGIGPQRAKAIAKNRPYKGKDDLVARKIIPEAVYKKISDKIIAKQG